MKSITTTIAEICFDENESLLHIKVIEGAEMTLENTKGHYEEIKKITGGKPHFALVDSSQYFRADLGALEYASVAGELLNRMAIAHYNSVMANKLTINFFKVNCKPGSDIKVFNTREEALEWLRTLMTLNITSCKG